MKTIIYCLSIFGIMIMSMIMLSSELTELTKERDRLLIENTDLKYTILMSEYNPIKCESAYHDYMHVMWKIEF